MDAREFKVTDVLTRNERFIVPLYQRQYQWHDEYDGGRTKAFWLDVAAKAGDVLEGQAKFDHYMGALLLAPDVSQRSFGSTLITHVVDGQQRLTTFLILIAAMRQIAIGRGFDSVATQCQRLLFNETGRADTDELARFKLTPTPTDRDVFIDILEQPMAEVRRKYRAKGLYWGGGVPKNTSRRALRAYEFFLAQIEEFVKNGPGDETEIDIDDETAAVADASSAPVEEDRFLERLSAVLEAVVFHLKLIVITLGPEDDAQVIFETLNSAGQPLLAMDLVRNNVFHRAEAQNRGKQDARARTERLYDEVWGPFDDAWWREPAPNARPTRPRIDHFLANVLTTETGDRTTVRELYAEYRAWATPNRRPRFEAVEDELAVLNRYAPAYEALEGRVDDGSTLAWLGERLKMWQNTTAYPIAFQIAEPDVDEGTRRNIARLIDSYLVRRTLCDLTPKNLNQIFPRLSSRLRRDGVSVATVQDFFAGLAGPTTRFPDDVELRACILEKQAYGRIPSRILNDIFWEFEAALRTKMTETTKRPGSLWVEHVMPQTWQTNWQIVDETTQALVGPEDPRYWRRDAAVHTLGNLTIVTDTLNRSLSNLSFDTKKLKLVEHSNLTLNRKIAEQTSWDETKIAERGETLASLAFSIWPTPAGLLG